MGQSKLKKQQSTNKPLTEDLVRAVSQALIKLARAASAQYGVDCAMHAGLGQQLLKREGIDAQIVNGEAAWRVGEGDGDMVVHAKMPGMVYQGENALAFHSWLEYGEYIIDFTVYQLVEKAEALDQLDGGKTTVDWCPDYLFAKRETATSLHAATQGGTGLYHYRKDPVIHNKVMANWKGVDQEDLNNLIRIMDNPDMMVLGPMNMGL
ncbi:hypothetical protein ACKF11_12850 [Methylobacillus sp. Pita2]|uniref:hypothetical protein n=1 Tax=Methylobacillus sp. Pita2 TaxID=3383245 RepID=UPI0038B5D4A2